MLLSFSVHVLSVHVDNCGASHHKNAHQEFTILNAGTSRTKPRINYNIATI